MSGLILSGVIAVLIITLLLYGQWRLKLIFTPDDLKQLFKQSNFHDKNQFDDELFLKGHFYGPQNYIVLMEPVDHGGFREAGKIEKKG